MVSPAGGKDLPRVTIQLLGAFQVTVGDRRVESRAWKLRKASEIVKRLALAQSHQLHRDQLVDQMWPDADGDWAVASFHQALHAARHALEPERAARSSESILPLRQQVLSLAPLCDLRIDAEAFLTNAARARAAGSLSDCRAALAAYTGELLPEDLYEDWTVGPREALRSAYVALLSETARLQQIAGQAGEAITALQSLVAVDPLNEAAHGSLMQLLAAAGQREQALRLYQQLRERLHGELAVEPAADLVDLAAQVAEGSLSATLVTPPSPTGIEVPASVEISTERPAPAHPSVSLIELARESGLVGRAPELTRLQDAFDACFGGHGQIALLAGEPGIGKTRLAEEVAEYAALQGALVLWSRCHETEGAPAFWMWSQLVRAAMRASTADQLRDDLAGGIGPIAQVVPELRGIIPDAPPPIDLDPAQARFRFFDSLTEYLDRLSARQPLVLVIDDLQWADPSSVLLLEFVADHLKARRLLLLGTYRIVEAYQTRAITQALERIGRSQATQRVELQGLEPDATARLGSRIAGYDLPPELANSIQQRTDGNPLFVRELARLLVEEQRDEIPNHPGRWGGVVPIAVKDAVNLRAEHLSDAARGALITASVIGAAFSVDVLAAVSGITIDDLLDLLDEAVAYRLVTSDLEDVNRFRFTHGLIREAIESGLIGARRARLHARIGDTLARLREDSADPPFAEIAQHFAQAAAAGRADDATGYSIRAGEQAMARLAYAEAATQFRQAVDLLDRYQSDRKPELADALLQLGKAQLTAGEPLDAHLSLKRAVDLAREIGDVERQATAVLELVETAYALPPEYGVDTLPLLQESLATLPDEDSSLHARNLSALAALATYCYNLTGKLLVVDQPIAIAREAVAVADRLDDPAISFAAIDALHQIQNTYDNVEETLSDANKMLRLANEIRTPRELLLAHATRINALIRLGEVDQVDQALDAYNRIATEQRLTVNIWSAALKTAMRAFMRGNLSEAETLIERARNIGHSVSADESRLGYVLQMSMLRREQDRLRDVVELASSEVPLHLNQIFLNVLVATNSAESGGHIDASATVDEVFEAITGMVPRRTLWLASLALLSETYAMLGDKKRAGILAELLFPYRRLFLSPGGNLIFLGPVSHFLGLLAVTLGRHQEATALFEEAVQMEDKARTPILKGHTQLAYADLLGRHLGQRDAALRLLHEVKGTAVRLNLARVQRIVREKESSLDACRSP